MDWREALEPRKGIRHKTTYQRPDGTSFTVEHYYVLGMPVINQHALHRTIEMGGPRAQRARAKLAVLKRDGFKCTLCGSPDNLTIDHVRYPKDRLVTRRNAIDYPLEDCQTLCVVCHKQKNIRNGIIYMNCADCGQRVTFKAGEEPQDLAFCWTHQRNPGVVEEKQEEENDGKARDDI